MITLDLCIKNIQGDIATVGNSIKIDSVDNKYMETDRYYKVTNIDNSTIELDNAFTLKLNDIADFKLLGLTK